MWYSRLASKASQKAMIKRLKEVAESITIPNYGYGGLFFNHEQNKVWWMSADCNEESEAQEIEAMFRKLGVDVQVESETSPPSDEPGWVDIDYKHASTA